MLLGRESRVSELRSTHSAMENKFTRQKLHLQLGDSKKIANTERMRQCFKDMLGLCGIRAVLCVEQAKL